MKTSSTFLLLGIKPAIELYMGTEGDDQHIYKMPSHRPEFDVVVYGSTSAGVAAAIQSARLGNRVALVSPNEHIGSVGPTP